MWAITCAWRTGPSFHTRCLYRCPFYTRISTLCNINSLPDDFVLFFSGKKGRLVGAGLSCSLCCLHLWAVGPPPAWEESAESVGWTLWEEHVRRRVKLCKVRSFLHITHMRVLHFVLYRVSIGGQCAQIRLFFSKAQIFYTGSFLLCNWLGVSKYWEYSKSIIRQLIKILYLTEETEQGATCQPIVIETI